MLSILRKVVEALFGTGISKFPLVSSLYTFLLRLLIPRFIEVEGYKVHLGSQPVDIHTGSIALGVFERFETELFKKEVTEGATVLDISANFGYYTLLAANLVGESGTVFAFEPHLGNFATLQKNVEINGCKNVVPVKRAVSDKSGYANLFMGGDNTLHSLSNRVGKAIMVETVALDEFFDEDCQVDVIKIDIEGAEMLALLGAERLIRRNGGLKIFTEFTPAFLARTGFSAEEYLNKLVSYGFKLYNINEHKKALEPIEETDFESICGTKGTNLYGIQQVN